MNLKTKFGEKEESDEGADIENYASSGQGRRLNFIWPNGKRISLSYAYLVTHEYDPAANTITLIYTTHIVVLEGRNLAPLYDDIFEDRVKTITAIDERYAQTKKEEETVVFGIGVCRNE
jgi:hypothetical protein